MQNILIDIYRDFTLATRLIFKGDTACYFLYGLDRFSTDLDFNITNEYESADILNRLRKILIKYGTLREERIKRYTIFCMLSYGSSEHNIKVEISTR